MTTMPQVYRISDYAALLRTMGVYLWTEADLRRLGIYPAPPATLITKETLLNV